MKRMAGATLCLAIFLAGLALGERRNAATWNDHSSVERIMYTNGYFEGYVRGSAESTLVSTFLLTQKYKIPIPDVEKLDSSKFEKMRMELQEQAGTASNKHTNTVEIEKGMDALYADVRNRSVCWPDAFKFSAMFINGDVPTEQELTTARKTGAESNCN
jgi:hypothetical protein